MTKVRKKGFLTEASFGCICFGLYKRDREFHTFKKKYVRDFIESVKGGTVCAFNRFFESKQADQKYYPVLKNI